MIDDPHHTGALTRNLIRDAICEKCAGVSRKQAPAYVDAVIEEICDALYRGEDVALYEFGKFCIRTRDERAGFQSVDPSGNYDRSPQGRHFQTVARSPEEDEQILK